jgi:hypothetical protein
VLPECDHAEITAVNAASMVYEYLCLLSAGKK